MVPSIYKNFILCKALHTWICSLDTFAGFLAIGINSSSFLYCIFASCIFLFCRFFLSLSIYFCFRWILSNFCKTLSKKKHSKRCLTNKNFFGIYKKILAPTGKTFLRQIIKICLILVDLISKKLLFLSFITLCFCFFKNAIF